MSGNIRFVVNLMVLIPKLRLGISCDGSSNGFRYEQLDRSSDDPRFTGLLERCGCDNHLYFSATALILAPELFVAKLVGLSEDSFRVETMPFQKILKATGLLSFPGHRFSTWHHAAHGQPL